MVSNLMGDYVITNSTVSTSCGDKYPLADLFISSFNNKIIR